MSAVAGIDRWRGGWMVAEIVDADLTLWASPNIDEPCTRLVNHAAVAIDMPIALAVTGRRHAEAELRATLGSASRSVFTSPTRAAALAESQNQATIVNRANGGPGISAQAFGLFASIRELRAALQGADFHHWWETHPETAFVHLHGSPLASKRTGLGVAQRLDLLRRHIPSLDSALLTAPEQVPIDDVLDAIAAAWSAERIANSQAAVYGPVGRDDEGFALGIRI